MQVELNKDFTSNRKPFIKNSKISTIRAIAIKNARTRAYVRSRHADGNRSVALPPASRLDAGLRLESGRGARDGSNTVPAATAPARTPGSMRSR
jgi:hypothetical protein